MPVQKVFQEFDATYDVNGYNKKDALAFAIASHLSYKNAATTAEVLNLWGFNNNQFFEAKRGGDVNTQGYIGANQNRMIVSFRGSEPIIEDWLSNIQFMTDPGPFGNTKVHEGFQDALFPVIMQLTYALKQYERANQKIWVTGHSLGGALASLFAAMLLERGLPLAGVYTYAAPRVGDKKYEKAMNTLTEDLTIQSWRVVNEGDIVPHLPPEPWFSHAGSRKLLKKDGTVSEDAGLWAKFKHEIGDWFSRIRRRIKIASVHRLNTPEGYIPALQNQLNNP